jgi:hypothetical protein
MTWKLLKFGQFWVETVNSLSKTQPMNDSISTSGFAILPSGLSPEVIDKLRKQLGPTTGAGRRGMLNHDSIKELAYSAPLLNLVRPHLHGEPKAVRAIYFDKSQSVNWLVPWHQDLTIPIAPVAMATAGAYAHAGGNDDSSWSIKGAHDRVQPPADALEHMITLRLHLDDTDEDNGAAKVIPGSHLYGKLSAEDIQQLRQQTPEVICRVASGEAMLMRPLLLHASGKSRSDRSRRILHIEYAALDLPEGLEWTEE